MPESKKFPARAGNYERRYSMNRRAHDDDSDDDTREAFYEEVQMPLMRHGIATQVTCADRPAQNDPVLSASRCARQPARSGRAAHDRAPPPLPSPLAALRRRASLDSRARNDADNDADVDDADGDGSSTRWGTRACRRRTWTQRPRTIARRTARDGRSSAPEPLDGVRESA